MKLLLLFSIFSFSIFCQVSKDDSFKWYKAKKAPLNEWCHIKSYSGNHFFYMSFINECKSELQETFKVYSIDSTEVGEKRTADVNYDGEYTFWRTSYNEDYDVEVRFYDYGQFGFVSIVFIEI